VLKVVYIRIYFLCPTKSYVCEDNISCQLQKNVHNSRPLLVYLCFSACPCHTPNCTGFTRISFSS